MANCPECGISINYLISVKTRAIRSTYFDYGDVEVVGIDTIGKSWYCPTCGSLLFTKEEQAINFLEDEEVNNDKS